MKQKVSAIWHEESALPTTKIDSSESPRTIFHELFHAEIPDSEKHPSRMWQEGQIVIGAGIVFTKRYAY